MTVEEAGRKGGLRTAETHGGEFYTEIGCKGGKVVVQKVDKKFASLFRKEASVRKIGMTTV